MIALHVTEQRQPNGMGLETHTSDGYSMLGGRKITATLTGETLEWSVAK